MEIGRCPREKMDETITSYVPLIQDFLKGENMSMSYYVDFKVESKKNEGKRRVHSPGKESVLANVI